MVLTRNGSEAYFDSSFVCEETFLVFNTTVVSFNCFTILKMNSGKYDHKKLCDKKCGKMNAKVPSYDEFMGLNMTQLKRACDSDSFSNINVDVNYHFGTRQWYSNKRVLNSIIWSSHEYPLLNDLLVVCNLAPRYGQVGWRPSGTSQARYCTKNSGALDHSRRDFVAWKVQNRNISGARSLELNRGYYLCAEDAFLPSNLKIGQLHEARAKCGRNGILTPDLCNDTTMRKRVVQLANDAQRLFNLEPLSNMWTGTERFNATHFYEASKWTTNFESCRSSIISNGVNEDYLTFPSETCVSLDHIWINGAELGLTLSFC